MFFISNGVSPEIAKDWLITNHTYDIKNKHKEAHDLVERYNKGELDKYDTYVIDFEQEKKRKKFEKKEIPFLDMNYIEDINWEFINSFPINKQKELHSLKNTMGELRFAMNRNYFYEEEKAFKKRKIN